MVNEPASGQASPGRLEDVRTLLNSWLIPNDTRVPEDRFDTYADERGIPHTKRADLRRLRDELRLVVNRSATADEIFNWWVERLGIRPYIADGAVTYRADVGVTGEIVGTCLAALSSGQWSRLKACPDCQWVFFDHSRNASKRWCLMTADGPDGRSCGSIAKVRAYRQRARERT